MKESANIIRCKDVLTDNIIYDKCINHDSIFASCKIWYKSDAKTIKTFIVQTNYFEILDVHKSNDPILIVDEAFSQLFETIDKKSVEYLKKNDILNKLGLTKNARYKSSVNDMDSKTIFRNKLSDDVRFYISDGNKKISKAEAIEYMSKGTLIKTILEISEVMIDIKNNVIMTLIEPLQILIDKVLPQQITLDEFSFIQSDPESSESESQSDDQNIDQELSEQSEQSNQYGDIEFSE